MISADLLNVLPHDWPQLLIGLTIKSSAMIFLVMIIIRLGRFSAATRHLAWMFSFYLTVLFAFASFIPPVTTISVAPNWGEALMIPAPGDPTAKSPSAAITNPEILQQSAATTGQTPVLPLEGISTSQYLLLIWCFGMLLGLTKIVADMVIVLAIGWRATTATEPRLLEDFFRKLAACKLWRRPRLKFSKLVRTPFTYGVIFPVIVLPEYLRWSSQSEQDLVLRHELAHVVRFDYLSSLIARVCLVVFWFHPLLHYAYRNLKREQEQACDDWVILSGAPALDYAQCLVSMMRNLKQWPLSPLKQVPGMAVTSTLGSRVKSVLNNAQHRQSPTFNHFMITVMVLSVVGLAVGMIAVEQQSETPPQYAVLPVINQDYPDNDDKQMTIMEGLRHIQPAPRIEAAQKAGNMRDSESIPALTELLQDSEYEVRLAAVRALGEFRSRKLFYNLLPKIVEQRVEMRIAVIDALAGIGCQPAFVAIACHLQDNSHEVRAAAAKALQKFDPQLMSSNLTEILRAQGRTNRRYMQKYIPNLPQLSARELLGRLQKDSPSDITHR